MTRSRAVELLKGIQFCCDLDDCTNAWDCEECDNALNMAIEALEQQTAKCDNCKYSEETDGMNCYECLKGMSDNFEALDQDEIVRCKDCKYWHEWEHGTGSCHRSEIMWVGSDYYDYCSFAEKRGSDGE